MFQNLNETERTKEVSGNKKNILSNVISKKYIILYIITLMISMVNMGYNFSPFSIAILAAGISNEIPIIVMAILALIGNIVGSGVSSIISFIITLLIFFVSFLIVEPKYNDSSRNEKLMLARRVFISSLIVNIIGVFIKGFLLYDLLLAISMAMIITIFYKIFSNSLAIITNYNEKMAFSIEEVLGTSLLIAVSLCSLGSLSIYGFSVRNVLSIFIVLVLGWKHGILVGTTAGTTIGVSLGVIAGIEPIVVAAYAICGMISGILNRFGKIGVICGFVLGNVILSYVANGMVAHLILFKEILIAGLALLVVPKNVHIELETILGENKFLPTGVSRGLNKSRETANKLNNVSKVVKDMADTYKNAAATIIDEEDIKEKNKQKFIAELLNNIEHMESNILHENISDVEGPLVNEIFLELMDKGFIREKDLIKILAKNNQYIIGFNQNENGVNRDIQKMTEAINSAFRISKMNFVWSIRLNEEKKNFEKQLNNVSKAIENIAEDIKDDIKNEDTNTDKKEEIILLLKQKEIFVEEIEINKKENDRYKIDLYIQETKNEKTEKVIINILNKVLEEKLEITKQEILKEKNITKYNIISEDRFILDIGHSIAVKDEMPVSGDSIIRTKLQDGKYLIAISDGMGAGPEARKSSQIVISMLKRLLNSGFEKDISIDLINSNLLSVSDEVFATLDIAIVDLYKGNVEFIKNGACPTYIKNNKRIQIVKSLTLPTGVIKDTYTDVFDKDLDNNDIVVMISDGILESNVEYKNKELWVKYLLADIEITNPQKISDIILNEAVDNTFGKIKDDMSVITFKIIKKD